MISRGGLEKENAEQVLKLMNDYIKFNNLTKEQYEKEVMLSLSYQLKYQKLLKEKYNGSTEALMSEIEKQYNNMKK